MLKLFEVDKKEGDYSKNKNVRIDLNSFILDKYFMLAILETLALISRIIWTGLVYYHINLTRRLLWSSSTVLKLLKCSNLNHSMDFTRAKSDLLVINYLDRQFCTSPLEITLRDLARTSFLGWQHQKKSFYPQR